MEISYKKLFVLIVEKDMTNSQVRKTAKQIGRASCRERV